MDVCLPVLKESNKSRLDSYSVRNSVLNISHITFRDCRVHIFSDNLSRNSCKLFHMFKVIFIFTIGYIKKSKLAFSSVGLISSITVALRPVIAKDSIPSQA